MQVILLETLRNVGRLGDMVDVKPGYARNYLIPEGIAVFANNENKARFEANRAELEKKAKQALSNAEQRAARINDVRVVIAAMASDEGKLYGSVAAAEIQDALTAQGIEVSKREIVMSEGPIHSTGDYKVEVHVHSEVIALLQVQVVATK